MMTKHVVISLSLTVNSTNWTTVAGNYSFRRDTNQLFNPNVIFVNITFYLYVADTYNHRIQLFEIGEPNGTTIVGSEVAANSIALNNLTGIVLDADNNLYIADQYRRIVKCDPNGFQCVVVYPNPNSSTTGNLYYPQSLSFDSNGNIFFIIPK
jgi:sugar lactone lactonase YvrE